MPQSTVQTLAFLAHKRSVKVVVYSPWSCVEDDAFFWLKMSQRLRIPILFEPDLFKAFNINTVPSLVLTESRVKKVQGVSACKAYLMRFEA